MTDATPAAEAPSAAQMSQQVSPQLAHQNRAAAVLGDGSAAELLAVHLAAQAGDFLRGLPSVDLHTLRRVGAALHTFESLLDPAWSREMREELARLGTVLGQERAYGRRLTRLMAGLDSLTSTDPGSGADARAGAGAVTAGKPAAGAPTAGPVPHQREAEGLLARHPGAPKARALLERQLTLGRSRAHTAALQELGSARFHALADRMTLLASDLPLRAGRGDAPADELLC
ncbi:CHAD domain-containing protein, partial [Streptacidiphilus carbonis]|uniref:CHAD domain-containing protein n=1 Tax=Streptacidiphilus carbonis TaxID=105422 RepID=UPI00157AB509